MTTTFVLQRHKDHSGVSGTGLVAEGCEFSDGAVALRWHGDHPSTTAWDDIRDMEAVHGHNGDTTVEYTIDSVVCNNRSTLLAAYERVVPFLVWDRHRPLTCAEHPDHLGRLRLTFEGESEWRFWVALLDGSTYAAVHEEVAGETEHRWTSPDGLIWLAYFTTDLPAEELLAGEHYDDVQNLEGFDEL